VISVVENEYLFECVPNISVGRDMSLRDRLVSDLRQHALARIVDVDSGFDADRTVLTLIGNEQEIFSTVIALYRVAIPLLSMKAYSGNHPAVGVVDVCPIVPLTLKGDGCDCGVRAAALVMRLAESISLEHSLSVFVYGELASSKERTRLADIRRGGLSGLAERMLQEKWSPDFGPATLHATAGVTILGSRGVLVALNIDLATDRISLVQSIASQLRQERDRQSAGIDRRYEVLGWLQDSRGIGQVSFNLRDYEQYGLHDAYVATERIARDYGVQVLGVEIVGLVPRRSLVQAGRCFACKGSLEDSAMNEDDLIDIALDSMGLSKEKDIYVRDEVNASFIKTRRKF
jgi:glutamate formiminotransferase